MKKNDATEIFFGARLCASSVAYIPTQLCVVSEAAMAVMMVTMRLSRVFHFSLFMARNG